MTPKELLYLEDCLSVEQQLQIKCNDYSAKVQDPQLKTMLGDLAQKHQQRYSSIINNLN